MIAIGVVLLVASFLSTMYALLRPEWLDAQLSANPELFPADAMPSRKTLLWIIAGIGALGLIESGLSIALGMLILRGRRWATVTSLVLTILRLLIVAIPTVPVALYLSLTTLNGDLPKEWVRGALVTFSSCVGSLAVLLVLIAWLRSALLHEEPIAFEPGHPERA